MIKITPGECTDHRGYLQQRDADGCWVSSAVNKDGETPHVFKCEHQAFEAMMVIIEQAAMLICTGSEIGMPTPEDFRYVYAEMEPGAYTELLHVGDAATALQRIMKGLPRV